MFTSENESNFFLREITNEKKVLEYGSGESSMQISQRCKELVTVEHQRVWYDNLKKTLSPNTKILLHEPESHYIEGSHDGDWNQFKTYIESPLEYAPFDIILIDGRARVCCASICHKLGHENSLVFIHDFQRVEYHEAHKYLKLIDQKETMAKFKIIFQ